MRRLYVSIIAVWVTLPGVLSAASHELAMVLPSESASGKPAIVGSAMSFPVPGPDPAILGKLPTVWINDGPPPRSAGPGLQFDTRRFFYVYSDLRSGANHFAPSGWMGDYGDILLDDGNTEDPADGKTCLKISYLARSTEGNNWAGVYWQFPDNNWGGKSAGFNLAGMKRLTFWARGLRGGEEIAEFKVGGLQGRFPDSGSALIGPITLTQEWKQYAVDLSGVDLSKVAGGFAWSAGRAANPNGITFYLDEIRFER